MALPILRDSGAVVVSTAVGDGESEAALRGKASHLTRAIFGQTFVMAKEPCAIRAPPPHADADTVALFSPTGVGAEPLRPHNDGWDVYGELSPDYLMLFCVNPADHGGESFLLDGVRIGDAIGDTRLFNVDVETAFPRAEVRPGEDKWTATWRSPMIDRNGTRPIVRSGKGDQAVGGDRVGEALRGLYTDEIQKHAEVAPTFTLQRGEALVIDNCERSSVMRHRSNDLLIWMYHSDTNVQSRDKRFPYVYSSWLRRPLFPRKTQFCWRSDALESVGLDGPSALQDSSSAVQVYV